MGRFFVIQHFMIEELKLAGNELLVYALIYSYSQNKEGVYIGSIENIAERTGTSKSTVLRSISSLLEKGLLTKREYRKNGSPACSYSAEIVGTLHSVKMTKPQCQNDTMHSVKMTPSTYNNKEYIYKERNTNVFPKKVGKAERTTSSTESVKKGKRLPLDWTITAELTAYALEKGLEEKEILVEAELFKNHFLAVSGKNGVKLDWNRTFQNWILNCVKRKQSNQKANKPVLDTSWLE